MPRLFTAIDIPESLRRRIAWIELPPARITRLTSPNDLHITLHFIGEVTDAVCNDVRIGLRSVAGSAFVQQMNGVGMFANQDRPEILWVGVERSPELAALRDGIGGVLRSLRIRVDEREFNPHLTVARMKRYSPLAAEEFLQRNSTFHAGFAATSFSLYRVAPNGLEPHYQVVEEYTLRAL